MPTKLKILATDPYQIPTVEVELPDRCPSCGADFSEPNAVIEEQAMYTKQPFSFKGDEQEWGSSEVAWEGELPLGHRCAACDHKLTGHGLP